jgi:hypothetical protein
MNTGVKEVEFPWVSKINGASKRPTVSANMPLVLFYFFFCPGVAKSQEAHVVTGRAGHLSHVT